jgi:tungstate transport system substrate-binding protein
LDRADLEGSIAAASVNLRAPLLSILLAILLALGCVTQTPSRRIALATTTSVDNSGLLTVLLPAFRAQTGIEADLVTPGSGIALQMLKRGDVDIVISHAPAREAELLRDTDGSTGRSCSTIS